MQKPVEWGEVRGGVEVVRAGKGDGDEGGAVGDGVAGVVGLARGGGRLVDVVVSRGGGGVVVGGYQVSRGGRKGDLVDPVGEAAALIGVLVVRFLGRGLRVRRGGQAFHGRETPVRETHQVFLFEMRRFHGVLGDGGRWDDEVADAARKGWTGLSTNKLTSVERLDENRNRTMPFRLSKMCKIILRNECVKVIRK